MGPRTLVPKLVDQVLQVIARSGGVPCSLVQHFLFLAAGVESCPLLHLNLLSLLKLATSIEVPFIACIHLLLHLRQDAVVPRVLAPEVGLDVVRNVVDLRLALVRVPLLLVHVKGEDGAPLVGTETEQEVKQKEQQDGQDLEQLHAVLQLLFRGSLARILTALRSGPCLLPSAVHFADVSTEHLCENVINILRIHLGAMRTAVVSVTHPFLHAFFPKPVILRPLLGIRQGTKCFADGFERLFGFRVRALVRMAR
mmetsp:Transcript_66850/g.118629  ORF Transcript_66850/g.118629 Transcript_66850/m.118629 type:complete len:254 (-) Transcript_66850:174-935(-)